VCIIYSCPGNTPKKHLSSDFFHFLIVKIISLFSEDKCFFKFYSDERAPRSTVVEEVVSVMEEGGSGATLDNGYGFDDGLIVAFSITGIVLLAFLAGLFWICFKRTPTMISLQCLPNFAAIWIRISDFWNQIPIRIQIGATFGSFWMRIRTFCCGCPVLANLSYDRGSFAAQLSVVEVGSPLASSTMIDMTNVLTWNTVWDDASSSSSISSLETLYRLYDPTQDGPRSDPEDPVDPLPSLV
jgi:hypothetical protein